MEAVKDVPSVPLEHSTPTVNILVTTPGRDGPELRKTYDATHDHHVQWTTLEKSSQTKKINVMADSLQETYNATDSGNRWNFGSTTFCRSAGL